jgi:hypothetical protein
MALFRPALAVAVLLAACCTAPTAPSKPVVVTLAPGQSGAALGLLVKFIGVTSDSRCPANVMCVWAGDASVALETSLLGSRREVELQLNNPANKSAAHGNYRITFDALAPYPFSPRGILPGDYRATFEVTGR